MANSKRKCAFCGERKLANSMHIHGTQAFCNKEHFIEYAASQSKRLIKKGDAIRRKESNKAHRERKKAVKPIKYWQDKLQVLVNQWIVHVRDKGKPCCTCGTTSPDIKYDAGHYRSRAACPELRYEPLNIHKQCSVKCNVHGSGMRHEYRGFLIETYGSDTLDWLDGNHTPLKEKFPHWTDYENEVIRYRKLLRENGIEPINRG